MNPAFWFVTVPCVVILCIMMIVDHHKLAKAEEELRELRALSDGKLHVWLATSKGRADLILCTARDLQGTALMHGGTCDLGTWSARMGQGMIRAEWRAGRDTRPSRAAGLVQPANADDAPEE